MDKDKDKKGGAGGFLKFWEAYPKKRSKGQAEKAWNTLKPDEQLQDRILGAIERAKTSAEWKKDAGQYIPYPATWIRAKCWEDDYGRSVKTTKDLVQEALETEV